MVGLVYKIDAVLITAYIQGVYNVRIEATRRYTKISVFKLGNF